MMASLYQSCSARSMRGDAPIRAARWLSTRIVSACWSALAMRASLRPVEAPDHVRTLLRVQPHVLDLACPCETTADDKVLGFGGRAIAQAEFPERDFKMRGLRHMRIEVDREEQEIAPVGRALAVVEDVVVP